ncbi:MAG: CpsD/CapB family tyrosine-protein kinase [Anaerolineae bacterium]
MNTEQSALVTISDPDSPASEAYRALRTNLAFAGLDKPLRTLMVTSPGAEEGKSTVLANLGVSLAQGEQRVLIIDADLRQPSQHILFGLSNDEGLTSMLINADAAARPPVRETTVPGLRVLTSGPLPPRPADLLGSKRMMDVLARLKEEADLLLFDSPPINAMADAAILATKVDGVLLVVRERRTRREAVMEARDRLNRVHAPLLGAVLNGTTLDQSFARYYGKR